jgi:transformation/transcription domain-associated protein
MAFLAYVLRGSTNNDIKPFLDLFPEACVRLLKDCPPEDVATRKVSKVSASTGCKLTSRNCWWQHDIS